MIEEQLGASIDVYPLQRPDARWAKQASGEIFRRLVGLRYSVALDGFVCWNSWFQDQHHEEQHS